MLRDALVGAPELVTIAEVNEPQAALLPYLGTDDAAECDLVYQFAHFPLAVHALLGGDGSHYKRWLRTLEPFAGRQFITVLGSHDGMGRKPLLGLLPERDLEWLVDTLVTAHGALPNYARQPGGGRIVYELCATPWSLLNRPDRRRGTCLADRPLRGVRGARPGAARGARVLPQRPAGRAQRGSTPGSSTSTARSTASSSPRGRCSPSWTIGARRWRGCWPGCCA